KDIPHFWTLFLDHLLGRLDRRDIATLFKFVVDEGLVQLECHLLGKAALMQFQLRPSNDHGTARVIDALSEKVLAETPLLALDHVRERLQWTAIGTLNRLAATA